MMNPITEYYEYRASRGDAAAMCELGDFYSGKQYRILEESAPRRRGMPDGLLMWQSVDSGKENSREAPDGRANGETGGQKVFSLIVVEKEAIQPEKNAKEAFHWYQTGAAAGNPRCMYRYF